MKPVGHGLHLLAAFAFVALFTAMGGDIRSASAASTLPPAAQQQVCVENRVGGEPLHHAGIVIMFPDGTDTYCVSFEEDELSGAELLQRTGLPLVLSGFGGMGAGVCRIDDVGCSDPGDCFCQCRGADCHYWNYYELGADGWRYLPMGASQRRIHDGDVDGWVWGNGRTAPAPASPGSLCPAFQPTPRPTSTPRPRNAPATPTPTTEGTRTTVPPSVSGGQPPQPTVAPTAQTTFGTTTTLTTTPVPRVVRESSRPTSEVADTVRSSGEGAGRVNSLVWFAVAVVSLIVVAGGIVIRNRLHGR